MLCCILNAIGLLTIQQVPLYNRQNRSPSLGSRSTTYLGSASGSGQHRIPHTFSIHTYTRPTVCQFCKKLLRGLFKQGVQCRDCHYNAHKKCVEKIPKDCSGESVNGPIDILNDFCINNERDSLFKDDLDDSDFDDNPYLNNNNNNNNLNNNNLNTNSETNKTTISNASTLQQSDPELDTLDMLASEQARQSSSSSSSPSANIPLMRIVQSVKHTKRRGGRATKEGWLVHFTNKDKNVKRHYWRLDSKAITLFVSDQGSKYYKEIPLNEILIIETGKKLQGGIIS